MSKLIDKAFAKAYARRRPEPAAAAPSNDTESAPDAPSAGIERTETGSPSGLPRPHLEMTAVNSAASTAASEMIVVAGVGEAPSVPAENPTPIDSTSLHAFLCNVTDVVASAWSTGTGIGIPGLPEAAASAPPSVSTPAARPATPVDAEPSEPTAPPSEPEATEPRQTTELPQPIHGNEEELLEGLKRAVDAVKQTDDRLRRAAETSQMFVPLWEVDRFQWPDVVLRLEQRKGSELQAAAEGMLLASCRGTKTLGITALTTGRGASTITLLLAKSLIGIGGKVAMVDAAGTLAGLAELCGIEAPYGWNTALVENKPLEEGATISMAESSVIISWAPDAALSLAELPGDRMAQAWKRLQSTYDMTLVDLPPLDAGAIDALERHRSLCDAVLLLQTPRDEAAQIEAAVARIEATGKSAVGLVQNGFVESPN